MCDENKLDRGFNWPLAITIVLYGGALIVVCFILWKALH